MFGQVVDAWVVFRVPTFVIVLAAEIVMVVGGAGAGCALWASLTLTLTPTLPRCTLRAQRQASRRVDLSLLLH